MIRAPAGHKHARREANASPYANERALLFAGLNDREHAIAALNEMSALGPQRVGLYLEYPEFAQLRSDPAVTTLRQRLGLVR